MFMRMHNYFPGTAFNERDFSSTQSAGEVSALKTKPPSWIVVVPQDVAEDVIENLPSDWSIFRCKIRRGNQL